MAAAGNELGRPRNTPAIPLYRRPSRRRRRIQVVHLGRPRISGWRLASAIQRIKKRSVVVAVQYQQAVKVMKELCSGIMKGLIKRVAMLEAVEGKLMKEAYGIVPVMPSAVTASKSCYYY